MEKFTNNTTFTYGADPELFLLCEGIAVHARDHGFRSLKAKIGCDGNPRILEFRPDPSGNYKLIVSQIRSLMQEVFYKGYEIGLSGDYPIGFHIHVGFDKVPSNDEIERIAICLDNWLGEPFLTMNPQKRRQTNYFRLFRQFSDALRPKPYGFEYRVLPATVLYSPKIVEFIYSVVDYVLKNFEKASSFRYFEFSEWITALYEAKLIDSYVMNLPYHKKGSKPQAFLEALVGSDYDFKKAEDISTISEKRLKTYYKYYFKKGYFTKIPAITKAELESFFREVNPNRISHEDLIRNWGFNLQGKSFKVPSFSIGDKWFGYVVNRILNEFVNDPTSSFRNFAGYRFFGMKESKGDEPIVGYYNSPDVIGIPYSWRYPSGLSYTQIISKFRALSLKVKALF